MVAMSFTHYSEIHAQPSVAGVIETFWSLRPGSDRSLSYRLFPDGCADIVIDQRGGIFVSGVTTEPGFWHVDRDCFLLGARLQPGAVQCVLGVSGKELRDRVIPLESIQGSSVRNWPDQVLSSGDLSEKVDVLTKLIADRCFRPISSNSLVVNSVRLLHNAVAVHAIAGKLGISERHFRRIFEREVGVGPRRFARMIRFQKVLDFLRAGRSVTWAELAQMQGYADQSHLSREIQQFSGLTPRGLRLAVTAPNR